MNSEEMETKIKYNVKKCIALENIKEEIAVNTLKKKKRIYKMLPCCSIFIICGLILMNGYGMLKIKEAKSDENINKKEMILNSQNNVISETQNIDIEEKNNEESNNVNSNNVDKSNEKPSKINANSVEKNNKNPSNINSNSVDKNNNVKLNIAEVLKKVNKNKIFYKKVTTSENAMFAYRPTIENLYKHADLVVIGKYDTDLKIYTTGVNICTQTKFNVSKVIKNTTNLNVSKHVTFNRTGGVLSLDKYMDNNPTIRDDEFKNIKVSERKNYYIIQEYGPENMLDFTKDTVTKNDEYILFLNYRGDQLTLNSSYYGMRKINKDNKIYDYDTQKYIHSELIIK